MTCRAGRMGGVIAPLLSAVLVLLTVALPEQSVDAANILGLFTSHSPSHLIVHMSVAKALAERGHNVTVVCSLKPAVTHEKINLIIIPPTEEQERQLSDMMTGLTQQENTMLNMFIMMLTSMTTMMDMQFEMLTDPRFTALYDMPDTKFDALIVGFFFNDYQLGMGAKFGCPVIVDWPTVSNVWLDDYIGNPTEAAYVPNLNIAVKAGERMTFLQRVQNQVSTMVFRAMTAVVNFRMKNYYAKLFPGEGFRTYAEAKKNISLIFVNGHFSEGTIRPNVPAIIEIGGIQVKEKPNPLPQDIAAHLNASAEHGAIFFCLGSNVKSSNFKPETMDVVYNVLSKLQQKVIWKWEDLEKTPGNSPNILYKKWLPQDDILAHPNMRLFITHAGKGGVTESMYHGVPMVALPVFADQGSNADKVAISGYGLKLNMLALTEDDLRVAVQEVLTNQTYRENVRKFSKLYRDRPLSARESVVYWTEYVIRHRGAAHMQSPLVHMNGIEAGNFDVYACIGVALFVALKLIKLLFRALRRLTCKKCSSNDAKDKKVKAQ